MLDSQLFDLGVFRYLLCCELSGVFQSIRHSNMVATSRAAQKASSAICASSAYTSIALFFSSGAQPTFLGSLSVRSNSSILRGKY